MPLDIGDGGSVALRRCWTHMALSVTAHRYFLHIDPVLRNHFELANDQRARMLCWRLDPADVAEKKRQGLVRLAGIFPDGQDWLLADPRQQGLASVRVVRGRLSTIAQDVSRLEYDADHLEEGLRLSEGSRLANVVALGARMFCPASLAPEDLLGMACLWGVVFVPVRGTAEQYASAVLAGATRNVFLLFLVAQELENSAKGAQSIRSACTTAERLHGLLANAVAASATRTAFDEAESVVSHDEPDYLSELGALGCLPAEDFALTLSTSPRRFNRYLLGLGVGQS